MVRTTCQVSLVFQQYKDIFHFETLPFAFFFLQGQLVNTELSRILHPTHNISLFLISTQFTRHNSQLMSCLSLCLLFIFMATTNLVTSQQSYAPSMCRNSTSALGYACNGLNNHCHTYLIFRAQPPYNNASSIASLLNSDSSHIAILNNISQSAPLVTRKELIVPINCSCAGNYYQSNTTYVVRRGDNPYLIGNATYEGSTTCKAIQHQRSGLVVDIFPHERLTIPLRCACPTKNQSRSGIKYLMTYVVKSGDAISTVALRFGADIGETLVANQKSVQDFIINPFTTLLVPLRNPPNSSMTVTPNGEPPAQSSPPATSPIPIPTQDSSENQKWNYFLYGLISGGGFVLLFGAVGFALLLQRRKRRVFGAQETDIVKKSEFALEMQPLELMENISKVAQSLKVFSFKDLQAATDNFSPNLRIGTGSVYRGEIINDNQEQQQVAIKQTEGNVSMEIEILNKINHSNIITLFGVCYNNGLWSLVYEYAMNGRLSDWIFPSPDGKEITPLSWEQRVQIILDIATGLDYLHVYTTPPHIHKDLRCSHVLLDQEFRAKISHFGLSKSIGKGELSQFAITQHIIGTRGYMAPEYLEHGLVTPKMDVYAFGILVLEILSGREAVSLCGGECVLLSEVLEPLLGEEWDKNKLREFMDPKLQENYPIDVAATLVRMVERCLRKEPSERPRMDDIVRLLSKALTSSLMSENFTSTIYSQTRSNSA